MVSTWTRLRAAVNPYAKRLTGRYSAYPLTAKEYVGALGSGYTLADARHYLQQNAYEPQYLSAAKRHPQTGALHDLSYRYVPSTHPDAATGVVLGHAWLPQQCQYHVHVFQTEQAGPQFFSHYELKPDLWPFDVERLRTHYRPRYGKEYLRGVTNLDLP